MPYHTDDATEVRAAKKLLASAYGGARWRAADRIMPFHDLLGNQVSLSRLHAAPGAPFLLAPERN
jgi:hypothetical protein